MKPNKEGIDRYQPKATDSEEVANWRKRMGTQAAKDIYKERAATAECVNAQARNSRPQSVHGSEASKKSRPSRRGSPSPTTWHARSLSNRNP